jgi:hypothetical protein
MTPETMLPRVVPGVHEGCPCCGGVSGTDGEGPCMGVKLGDPNETPTVRSRERRGHAGETRSRRLLPLSGAV